MPETKTPSPLAPQTAKVEDGVRWRIVDDGLVFRAYGMEAGVKILPTGKTEPVALPPVTFAGTEHLRPADQWIAVAPRSDTLVSFEPVAVSHRRRIARSARADRIDVAGLIDPEKDGKPAICTNDWHAKEMRRPADLKARTTLRVESKGQPASEGFIDTLVARLDAAGHRCVGALQGGAEHWKVWVAPHDLTHAWGVETTGKSDSIVPLSCRWE